MKLKCMMDLAPSIEFDDYFRVVLNISSIKLKHAKALQRLCTGQSEKLFLINFRHCQYSKAT